MERRVKEGKEGKKEGHGEREKKKQEGKKVKNWEEKKRRKRKDRIRQGEGKDFAHSPRDTVVFCLKSCVGKRSKLPPKRPKSKSSLWWS